MVRPSFRVYFKETHSFLRPTVEEANRTAPAFGRIFKEMILVADAARPFPRAGKGTFIRKQVIALYQDDIDKL